ncbi:MAG: sugar transferase [Sulfurovum sp.]|nr:sugar transferase [Sulfurovum sp.]
MVLYRSIVKLILDRSLALLLILFLSPLILFVAILVYIKIGRPMLFRQVRPGLHEKLFTIYKFRTMTNDRDEDGDLLPDGQRLEAFGTLVRSTSLDELPQLFNVLRGDMSFAGPRPLLVEYLPLYSERQKRRHEVRPGITGWAQINGRNTITWEQKFEYDVWYVENLSFGLDMKIAWMTLLRVIKRSDINSEKSITMGKFKGGR